MTERIIASSGGAHIAGPWGGAHPVSWALATGRVTDRSAPTWLSRYVADPGTTAATLASLAPVVDTARVAASTGPRSDGLDPYFALYGQDDPRPVHASGGQRPAGDASYAGTVDASPARDQTVYRNAVEELRANSPELVRAAERGGPAPAMFQGSGDYPLVTASGTDPALLRALPWRVRLAAAWARDPAEVARLVNGYADDPFAAQELDRNPAVQDYIGQVMFWARNSGLEQQIEDRMP